MRRKHRPLAATTRTADKGGICAPIDTLRITRDPRCMAAPLPEAVAIPIPDLPGALPGALALPPRPKGLVIFAHGSGSSRMSPRNRRVAERLNEAHLGTLLFDLLTPAEAEHRSEVFDIPLLGRRLRAAVHWARAEPRLGHLPLGLFGASTGAGAALMAAAELPEEIGAVVSRGGRPDLAAGALAKVEAPTLLVVGGADDVVVGLNRAAFARLGCERRLKIVPGASHLFEEPGALEAVASLAADWFEDHLASRPAGA